MNLWIVTIGSSDVQLDSNNETRRKGRTEKQRSDKVWSYWYEGEIKEKCHDLTFEPKPLYPDKDEAYRIAPRVLGEVYQASSPEQQTEIQSYLTFPLLDNFVAELKKSSELPDVIAILLTDQSLLFKDSPAQRKLRCPYWQDTCELQSILEFYFKDKEYGRFLEATLSWLILEPRSETESGCTKLKGLDDWNSVLDSVSDEFRNLELEIDGNKIDLESIKKVYVSHQAGTPAISSAVQFCSLAQFGSRVTFLVSNEQDDSLSDTVKSSAYLRGIKKEQAIKLLNHHDYLGVQDLVVEYLQSDIKNLLEAAIQWNFAHFAEGYNLIKSNKLVKKNDKRKSFVEILSQNPDFRDLVAERTGDDKWWWAAYEAAYLSFIRLKQGNTVEAVFHSFRSVESLLKIWAERKHPGELENTKHPRHQENPRWDRNLRSHGEDLYTFLTMKRTIDQSNDFDIWVFGNVVFKRRNELFHNIKGLSDQESVFEVWRSSNETQWKDQAKEKWKSRVLACLNFIVREDFPEGFKLEDASLMVRVHEELVAAIAAL